MQDGRDKSNPFGALIGVVSLLAALLYVAGFSYRWSYYYNFGVQHLVFKLSFQSFLITALELIRTPRAMAMVLLWIALPVLVLNLLLRQWLKAFRSRRRWVRRLRVHGAAAGLCSDLFVDFLRATLIVYATYRVASTIGYDVFLDHIRMQPWHPLPAVTAIVKGDKDNPILPLTCGFEPPADNLPSFVGDGQQLLELQRFFRTCSKAGKVSWRLLYRDADEIYLFAAEPEGGQNARKRPLTLVLPNHGDVALLME